MTDLLQRIERLSAKQRAALWWYIRRVSNNGAASGKTLVAYVESDTENPPASDELRCYLRERLPEHMIPADFVVLDSLPRTAAGKVDRGALPDVDEVAPADDVVAPRTPLEERLTQIWADVLGVDVIGVHDDFFELGGDSILSIRVLAKANEAGLHLTPQQFFEAPTVAGLATRVGESKTRDDADDTGTPRGLGESRRSRKKGSSH